MRERGVDGGYGTVQLVCHVPMLAANGVRGAQCWIGAWKLETTRRKRLACPLKSIVRKGQGGKVEMDDGVGEDDSGDGVDGDNASG